MILCNNLDAILVMEWDFKHALLVKAMVDLNGFYSSKSSSRTTGKNFSRNRQISQTQNCENVPLKQFMLNKILE